MKIDDLAYTIAGEALNLLEQKYHYRVADTHKEEIQAAVRKNVGQLVQHPSTASRIEQLAYDLAGEAFTLLERKYHYRVADDHKKDVQNTVRKSLNDYILHPAAPPEPPEEPGA